MLTSKFDQPGTAGHPVDGWGEDWTNKVVDAFERLVSVGSKKQLNEVKKREVNAIRRWAENKSQDLSLFQSTHTTKEKSEQRWSSHSPWYDGEEFWLDIWMRSSLWPPHPLPLMFRTFVSLGKTWGCWSTPTGITSSNFEPLFVWLSKFLPPESSRSCERRTSSITRWRSVLWRSSDCGTSRKRRGGSRSRRGLRRPKPVRQKERCWS